MRSMRRGGGRFLMGALSNGRCLKCLTIVDDFTKEAVDIVVDHGISGLYVAWALDHAARFRALPQSAAQGLRARVYEQSAKCAVPGLHGAILTPEWKQTVSSKFVLHPSFPSPQHATRERTSLLAPLPGSVNSLRSASKKYC